MPIPSTVETESVVRAMLEAAGLTDASAEELAVVVEMYPQMRAAADSLYIPEMLHEELALLFNPVLPGPRR